MSVNAVVHLGPMKTGTSSFAAHLSRREDDGDMPSSVIYPSGDLWFPRAGSITKHHDLVELAPAPPANAGERKRETSVTPDMILAKFEQIVSAARSRRGDVTVVFVCEIADQRAMPALGTILRKYFDRVDFVIVARDQQSALRSLMGQQIRMWKRREVLSTDPHEYVAKQARRGSYDYARLWEKWNVSSTDFAIHFVPYRDGSGTDDLSQDIFAAVGAGVFPHSVAVLSGERIHGNFTAVGMRTLTRLKRIAHTFRFVPGFDRAAKYLFDRTLRQLHGEVQRGEVTRESTWRFSPSDEANCRDAYRESNLRFRELLGQAASEPRWTAWFTRALDGRS